MARNTWRGGGTPKYTSKEQIEGLIAQYFEDCKGTPLLDKDGNPMVTKWGEPIIIGARPLTVSGLALALGFHSRQSLLNYKAKKEFTDTIEDAMLHIEAYTEERLYDKDGVNGARFSLQNNFRSWNEAAREKAEAGAPSVKIVCDIPREAPSSKANEVIEEVENEREGLESAKRKKREQEDAGDAVSVS